LNANALSSRFIKIEEFAAEEEQEEEIGLTTPTFFNNNDGDIFLRAKKDIFDLSSSTEEKEEAPPAKLDANESIHRRGLFFNALIDSCARVCLSEEEDYIPL
jgi:hypothetical protein